MWKLKVTYNKKKKKEVNQFKFETPITQQVDETIPKIEPFKNIEADPTLYELLKQWARDNNINSRRTYQNYLNNNPTITLNGRTFALPKLDALATSYRFYRDAIQPESQNQLTKEILFQILDSYFKNNNIPLNTKSYAKFIKQYRIAISVMGNRNLKPGTGILFNGQIYPVPNEMRTVTPTENRQFDSQAMSWLREYRDLQNNLQGSSDENTKYLWEADQNTLTKIIKQIIQDMLKAKLNIKLSNYNIYIKDFLPKIEHIVNDRVFYVPFIDFEGQRYLLYSTNDAFSKRFTDNAFNTTWKNEALEHYNKTIGAEQYLRRNLPTFHETFPQYTFKTEVPIAEIDPNFISWINDFQLEQIKKSKFNRRTLYDFLQNEFQGQPFQLATIKDADLFQIIPQDDGKYTIRVTRKLKTKEITKDIPNQIFGNVQPGKYALDLVVFQNNKPIAIYEFDGEFHYGEGQFGKLDLMSDLINDQIQKYYIQNKTNIPYYRVPYFLVTGGTEHFPEFVIKHLKQIK